MIILEVKLPKAEGGFSESDSLAGPCRVTVHCSGGYQLVRGLLFGTFEKIDAGDEEGANSSLVTN